MPKLHTTRMPMMSNSMGIITLENRSMPERTPRTMTMWVTAMKTAAQRMGFQGWETKVVKNSP